MDSDKANVNDQSNEDIPIATFAFRDDDPDTGSLLTNESTVTEGTNDSQYTDDESASNRQSRKRSASTADLSSDGERPKKSGPVFADFNLPMSSTPGTVMSGDDSNKWADEEERVARVIGEIRKIDELDEKEFERDAIVTD